MQEFLKVYKEHQDEIEQFVLQSLKNMGGMTDFTEKDFQALFTPFPSMELIYGVDKNMLQITPNIGRKTMDTGAVGRDRSYLKRKLTTLEEGFCISAPYVSSASGELCVTVMIEGPKCNVFIDFEVSVLLTRLGLVELHENFNKVLKGFYMLVGGLLMLFALLAIGYAIFEYIHHLLTDKALSLEQIFKPIVSLTLGLAIFDLAKTILEREVFFKNYAEDEKGDSRLLAKFLIAIIVALSIEALMVVFKIAINDYSQMLYALYLIVGVALIIFALGFYQAMSRKIDSRPKP